jgi:pimeloyl-ACP methyl ester carboxylesterase
MKHGEQIGFAQFLGILSVLLLHSVPIAQAEGPKRSLQNKNEVSMKNEILKGKKITGYAPVNGLKMYYEIEGTGEPLVFIPPAFGVAGAKSFPLLEKSHSVIQMDLQGNGRTADIPDRPLSVEQYAKDVVELLKFLKILKADFVGESYGGDTVAMIALRHPELVRRAVTYSATFAAPPATLDPVITHYEYTPTSETRDVQYQRETYQKTAPDPSYWPKIWQKLINIKWNGFSKEELASIKAPLLIIQGDRDFVKLEHSIDSFRLIPNAELAVVPSASHFALSSDQEKVLPMIQHFLEKSEKQIPLATATAGYHPGETR